MYVCSAVDRRKITLATSRRVVCRHKRGTFDRVPRAISPLSEYLPYANRRGCSDGHMVICSSLHPRDTSWLVISIS